MGVSPMVKVLLHIGGSLSIQHERSDLQVRRKERSAHDHGRDAHATVCESHHFRLAGVLR
jgi:hypothetical protein